VFGTYPVNTAVTVQEALTSTTQIQSISFPVSIPFSYLYGSPAFGQVTATVGPNVQYVVYTNRRVESGFIEICKNVIGSVPSPLPVFQFVVPGAGTVAVNAGECSGPIQVASGLVTIHELTTAPYVAVSCSAAPAPHACTFDSPNQNATVDVTPGGITQQTITTVTNQLPPPPCDLRIVKTMAPTPLVSGQPATVTLTVTNVGLGPCLPGAAPGTILRDNKPTGLTFTGSPVPNQPGWSCGLSGPGDATCANPSTLPSGYTVTFSLNAQVTAAPGSTITNCGQISNQNDSVMANNQSCVTRDVIGAPACNLRITKTMTPNPIHPNQTGTITMTVQNLGPGVCQNVTVVDNRDPRIQFFGNANTPALMAAGWSCTYPLGTAVSCSNASLPVGTWVISQIFGTLQTPLGSTIHNCATATATGAATQQSCVDLQVV